MSDQQFTEITLRLMPAEIVALKELARKSKRTLEETAECVVLIELIKQDLLNESAERNSGRLMRLDE